MIPTWISASALVTAPVTTSATAAGAAAGAGPGPVTAQPDPLAGRLPE
ncbi:hypothetical protein GTY54_45805 [Streptomyces sp. SID625]|nr:hypothetical protein [Streptomyces sp. SID625]